MTKPTLEKFISRLAFLREQIEAQSVEFDTLAKQVCALGKGDYTGTKGETVKVIEVSEGKPSYKLPSDNLDEVRHIAGENFAKLFEKRTTFEPCKAFGDVVVKILSKPLASKILAIVEKPGKAKFAYLKWS